MKDSKWLALVAVGSCVACAGSRAPATTLASASSCRQMSSADQTVAQLYSPGKVYAASPVEKKVHRARAYQPVQTFGASLYTHAEPGMTGPYMERALRCYAAFGRATHPNDPLHPSEGRITDVSVEAVKGSFAIRIESDSSKTGKEIWRRAQSLSGQSTNVEAQQVGAGDAQEANF